MLSRHQHELPPAVARNLDRLALGLVLKFSEFALEFQGARLNHDRYPTREVDQVRIIRIMWTHVNSSRLSWRFSTFLNFSGSFRSFAIAVSPLELLASYLAANQAG